MLVFSHHVIAVAVVRVYVYVFTGTVLMICDVALFYFIVDGFGGVMRFCIFVSPFDFGVVFRF